jgi:hypothetical protein
MRWLLTRVLVASVALSASLLFIVWWAVFTLPVVWIWRIFFLGNIAIGVAELIIIHVCMVPLLAAISGICEDISQHSSHMAQQAKTSPVQQAKTSLAARIAFVKVQVPFMVGFTTIALLPGLTGGVTTYGIPVYCILMFALQTKLSARQLRAHHTAIAQVDVRSVLTVSSKIRGSGTDRNSSSTNKSGPRTDDGTALDHSP